ncbi:MAG: glycosyltransferase family 39 protein [Candidatus Saganbacteria bacterium]|nr:glycosyltransferase family 39 protein [Candidatus Saganbacteria bacterium]
MLLINFLIFLLVPGLAGALTLAAVPTRRADEFNFWEKTALAFPLGLGLLCIAMYLLDLAGIPVTRAHIIIAALAYSALLLAYLGWQRRIKLPPLTIPPIRFDLDWQESALAALIALKLGFVSFAALIKPVVDVDAFQFYSIVAKGLYYHHTTLSPYLRNFFGGKPLLPFLAQGWVLIGLQTADDFWLKLLPPLLLISLIIVFYCTLRRSFSRKASLLFTFFLAALPLLAHHATTAYADLPVTAYFTLSWLCLFRFLKNFSCPAGERNYALLTVSFIFAALTIWAKNAGVVLASANLIALLACLWANRRRLNGADLRQFGLVFGCFLLLILPLLLQRATFIASVFLAFFGHTDATATAVAKTVVPVPLVEKTKTIGQTFFNKLLFYGDWQLTWGLLALALVFFYRQALAEPLRYLLIVLVLSLCSVFVQFEVNSTFVWLLDGTLMSRLLMNEAPLALFLAAEIILRGEADWRALTGRVSAAKAGRKSNTYSPKSSKRRSG